jgi:hypothetical protein
MRNKIDLSNDFKIIGNIVETLTKIESGQKYLNPEFDIFKSIRNIDESVLLNKLKKVLFLINDYHFNSIKLKLHDLKEKSQNNFIDQSYDNINYLSDISKKLDNIFTMILLINSLLLIIINNDDKQLLENLR